MSGHEITPAGRAHIKALVDEAPPLTQSQRAFLRGFLTPDERARLRASVLARIEQERIEQEQ